METNRNEPVFKGLVLLLTLLMVGAGGRQMLLEWRARRLNAFRYSGRELELPPAVGGGREGMPMAGSGVGPRTPLPPLAPGESFQRMELTPGPNSPRRKANWWSGSWDPFSKLGYSMNL